MRFRKAISLWTLLILGTLAGTAIGDDKPTPASTELLQAIPSDAPRGTPTLAREPDNPASATGILTPKLQPQSVMVMLINGTTIAGTISDADQWTMKTSFGTTNLPLSAVAGIRMAQEGNATTTVVLHNGDTITGAVQIGEVVVQTDWGRAEIMGTHVGSILFTPGLKWTTEPGLNGVRWRLVADESRTVPTTQPAATIAAQPRPATPPVRTPGRP